MTITDALLTHNRPYTKRTVTDAIAMHWVANPGTSAMANRNYFENTTTEVSSNFIVGLVGEIVRCIPEDEVSWCTNQANSHTVSVECCHPDWTGKFNDATYKSMVELAAYLCKKYGLDPLNGGVIRHFDVTGKDCPKWFVPASHGGTDTNRCDHWHQFIRDVSAKVKTGTSSSTASTSKITVDEAAKNVIKGLYGNGEERKKKIAALGLDYNTVQNKVNELLKSTGKVTSKITVDEAAKNVIKGLYGNGEERKKRLSALGLSYDAVQKRVNELLKGSTTSTSNDGVSPATSFDKSIAATYVVTADALNCRKKPGATDSASIITCIPGGTKVQCYGYYTVVNNSKWYLIQRGNIVGHVSAAYLKKV